MKWRNSKERESRESRSSTSSTITQTINATDIVDHSNITELDDSISDDIDGSHELTNHTARSPEPANHLSQSLPTSANHEPSSPAQSNHIAHYNSDNHNKNYTSLPYITSIIDKADNSSHETQFPGEDDSESDDDKLTID